MTDPDGDPTGPSDQTAHPHSDVARRLADQLVAVAGDTVAGILLYGSHLLGTNPDRHSAVDFVVVVDQYRPFYARLTAARQLHRPVGLMSALSRVLPPNVLAFAPGDGREGIAKYLLISRDDFERATGPAPPDHFVLGRIVQKVGVVYTRDGAARAHVEERLAMARRSVLWWTAPYVDGPIDAERLGLLMMEVCYAGELRPESTSRAQRVFDAQADHFRHTLPAALQEGLRDGTLRRDGDAWVLAEPVPDRESRRVRRYFLRSKARTTARWLKHTVTFVNWLPYIQRKVERHTGRRIELTRLEKKLPLVFLWPRVVHVLITRPRREIDS